MRGVTKDGTEIKRFAGGTAQESKRACLVSMKPWVQTLVLTEIKRLKNTRATNANNWDNIHF
jgi:hypothetical protein